VDPMKSVVFLPGGSAMKIEFPIAVGKEMGSDFQ
jgi:hypothetical protein